MIVINKDLRPTSIASQICTFRHCLYTHHIQIQPCHALRTAQSPRFVSVPCARKLGLRFFFIWSSYHDLPSDLAPTCSCRKEWPCLAVAPSRWRILKEDLRKGTCDGSLLYQPLDTETFSFLRTWSSQPRGILCLLLIEIPLSVSMLKGI